jgi:hypothetical protein
LDPLHAAWNPPFIKTLRPIAVTTQVGLTAETKM